MSYQAEAARKALRVRTAGRAAQRALAGGSVGEVCAVFRRSFYLRFPQERYVCVGDATLGQGPLNAIVERLLLPAMGERVSLPVVGARIWRPPDTASALSGEALAGRVALLTQSCRPPAEGLGSLITGGSTPLIEHAREPVRALDGWLATGGSLPDLAGRLIGLGPGLTPSGDDYFGGMMIALRSLGRGPDAEALWRWLEPRLSEGTSAISAAHLEAAAGGEAHEALHDCLSALLGARETEWGYPLAKLGAVGHCSGWDALAGALAAARAVSSTR